MMPRGIPTEILCLLAPRLAPLVSRAAGVTPAPVEEVRLREGRPVQVVYPNGDAFIRMDGSLTADPSQGEVATHDDLARTFQLMAQGSVYAWEEEVRSGFLTLRGGHRVGLTGRVVAEEGRIRTIKQVSSLNVRIAREVPGCAAPVLPRIIQGGRVLSTLIISPPQAGKTTLLRDLVRQISHGVPALGFRGQKVGLVDERSEVAACAAGVPQRDVGPRTDVLDACPKAEGMMLLIRSLSPEVIAVDEIGRPADAAAVMEALHAGVAVIATAHGADVADVAKRPAMADLLRAGAFRRAALLGRSRGPGTVERVVDLEGGWAATAPAGTARVPAEAATALAGTARLPAEAATAPAGTARMPAEEATAPAGAARMPAEAATAPAGAARMSAEEATTPAGAARMPARAVGGGRVGG